jgi:hypothetical protein
LINVKVVSILLAYEYVTVKPNVGKLNVLIINNY